MFQRADTTNFINTGNCGRQCRSNHSRRGYSLILVLGVVSVVTVLVMGLVTSVMNENWYSIQSRESEQAFQMAEAGLNYYTWYLNHNPGDFRDGNESAGDNYWHQFTDASGNPIGHFVLQIEEPGVGSMSGVIRSTGVLNNTKAPKRTIEAQVGIPTLANNILLSNVDTWIPAGVSMGGRVHSNGGILFNGEAQDLVTSALTGNWNCSAFPGCTGNNENAITGTGGPVGLWEYPVPAVDFNAITGNLAELRYRGDGSRGGLYFDPSGFYGYHLILKPNNTVEVYIVKQVFSNKADTYEDSNKTFLDDIKTFDTYPGSPFSMPQNGVIYVDDNVWVSGQTGSRVTIAAASFPETATNYRNIVIADDLTYTVQDGSTVIGLVAQGDLRLPKDCPDDLSVQAVLVAQKGKVVRPNYNSTKDTISLYGAVVSYQTWAWKWIDLNNGNLESGYQTINMSYDPHLTYNPPPYFPVGGRYEILTWEEVKPDL